MRKCTNTIKRGRPYHKTIAVIFASRLLQIRDDQWPHTDDVGYNIHKMRHTQVIGQDGLLQSGARGHPISLMGVIAGSAEKWSKIKITELGNRRGTPLGKSSFQLIHTVVESLLQQCSTVVATRKDFWSSCTSR